jgi:hypothetical protein
MFVTAEKCAESMRRVVHRLVKAEQKVCRCAITARARVGQKIGASKMWVHRVMGGYGKAKIQAHHWLNAHALHCRLERLRPASVFTAAQSAGAHFAALKTRRRYELTSQ